METVFRSYYTESAEITRYMVAELDLRPESRVLEPSAGHGALIDAVLAAAPSVTVQAYEINPVAITELNRRYGEMPNVNITDEDFLAVTADGLFETPTCYDRVIANPPYGGWQDYARRRELKTRYPDLYVKETYGLFLHNSIRVLHPGGVLVFIIPDTFLNLHMHTPLRRFILDNCKIRRISVFPSSLFPGVRFGYSKLCVVTLERCDSPTERRQNIVEFYSGMEEPNDLDTDNLEGFRRNPILQESISRNPDLAVLVSEVGNTVSLINSTATKLGQIAEVVTGFYSGNDKKHLRVTIRNPGKRKGYGFAGDQEIAQDEDLRQSCEVLAGLDGCRHFVPIVKGGGVAYWKPLEWVVDWSRATVAAYHQDRKARFQNAKYYFLRGIAIPMVTSTRVSATVMEGCIFDQSIVGVFPRDASLFNYLLAFFNSPTCTKLVRTLNPSANNSANYLKKLPIVYPPRATLDRISAAVEVVISKRQEGVVDFSAETEIEEEIREIYGC